MRPLSGEVLLTITSKVPKSALFKQTARWGAFEECPRRQNADLPGSRDFELPVEQDGARDPLRAMETAWEKTAFARALVPNPRRIGVAPASPNSPEASGPGSRNQPGLGSLTVTLGALPKLL